MTMITVSKNLHAPLPSYESTTTSMYVASPASATVWTTASVVLSPTAAAAAPAVGWLARLTELTDRSLKDVCSCRHASAGMWGGDFAARTFVSRQLPASRNWQLLPPPTVTKRPRHSIWRLINLDQSQTFRPPSLVYFCLPTHCKKFCQSSKTSNF